MNTVFKLDIKLGNDAMQTNDDVASKLVELATKVRAGDSGVIKDDNGNTVGKWGFYGE